MGFRADLAEAGKQGILLAVKWIIGMALVGFVSYGVITDYLTTRAAALRADGQSKAVIEYINKGIEDQKKAQAAPQPAPTPPVK